MSLLNRQQLLENARGELGFARAVLLEAIEEALKAADPGKAVERFLRVEGGRLVVGDENFEIRGRVLVISFGKAARPMLEAALWRLGKVHRALAVVPRGQGGFAQAVEAGHPLPDEGSLRAGELVRSMLGDLSERDLVIYLISGGGSAMLEVLPPGISLVDLRRTNELLLRCGASIHEVNAVRKHLSLVKGGQLARMSQPAQVLSLLLSDVPGDVKHVIASGLTEPDPSSFRDAYEVLSKYQLLDRVPSSVRGWMERGLRGEVEETPKPGDEVFLRCRSWIVASNSLSLKAAGEVGKKYGFKTSFSELAGEAREMGARMAGVRERGLHLFGGETTVTVRGPGKGGRNQELVLSACPHLSGRKSALFSMGTDGIDGETDAAGAMADGLTLERARALGMDPGDFLARNDSYHFFKALGDLLFTGPTGTNVMDVAAIINL